uniref:Uncharacterized protein n=1 Tax=Moniliophthora roreri TaxID=221103 RepID=A0A0W0F8N8_MONRR
MSTPNPRTGDWTRSGEPGSAFSGLSRGRRGGTRGGGPGRGRGGAARGANRGTKPPEVATDSPKPATEKPPPTPQRPKAPSRKPSAKNVPTTTSNASTTSSAAPITNTTSDAAATSTKNSSVRPSNRRKRSTTNTSSKAPPPITVPKISIDESASPMTPQNRRNSKASMGLNPPHSAPPMRDTPPHLMGSNSVNIDALVERVRAVAMDRPSTPGSGSHLDWAGDDDDSLPDLDDWGVHTEKHEGKEETEEKVEEKDERKEFSGVDEKIKGKGVLISPIMIDGLRSLPDAIPGSPGVKASPVLSNTHLSVEMSPKKRSISPAPKSPRAQSHRDATKSTLVPHPSLPPKPSFAPSSGRGGSRNQRPEREKFKEKTGKDKSAKVEKALTPAVVPMTSETDMPAPNGAEKQASPMAETTKSLSKEEEEDFTPQSGKGLKASIHTDPEADLDAADANRKGLQASIHAAPTAENLSSPEVHNAKMLNSSIHAPVPSLPSHLEKIPSPRVNGMTHTRAHTLGRPATIPNTGAFNSSRFSRSGTSTPRGRGFGEGRGGHARNHSSPPIAHGYRAPHSSRPISRLI